MLERRQIGDRGRPSWDGPEKRNAPDVPTTPSFRLVALLNQTEVREAGSADSGERSSTCPTRRLNWSVR